MARHRRGGRQSLLFGVAGVLLGLLAGVGIVTLGTRGGEPAAANRDPAMAGCATTSAVRVVGPEVVRELVADRAAALCLTVDFVAAGGRRGVRASQDADLWVSDSRVWRYARAQDPGAGTSVASSPVVGVMAPDAAGELAPTGTLRWSRLLEADRSARLAFVDPAGTATGLMSAWPLLQAQRAVATKRLQALALTARALATPAFVGEDAVSTPDPGMLVFTGEYLAAASDTATVLRGETSEAYLDFPAYNVATAHETRVLVDSLIRQLASPSASPARAAARLREPDGTARFDTTGLGVAPPRLPLPGRTSSIKLYGLSASGSTPGRILALVDRSGSMAATQPDGTRVFDVVRSTALIAMSTLYDHSSVGVWLCSHDDGHRGHRELVPVTSLGTGRQDIVDAVGSIDVASDPRTDLNRAVLDGYRSLQQTYDPASAQSIIVFTDGSPDRGRLDLATLIHRLKAAQDPDKPIRIIGVAFGADARIAALRAMSDTVGGKSTRVNDPVQLLSVVITVIGETAAAGGGTVA
ncbi:MAG: VWA domain-containing protein [Nocardioides sp.]